VVGLVEEVVEVIGEKDFDVANCLGNREGGSSSGLVWP
jgi:hypothetical protein